MGRDKQPKHRQLSRKVRKESQRASYARILIVTEGSKTEPLYLGEICAAYRLHSANVSVHPSQLGTAPIQVVDYAKNLFENGDQHKGIRPRSFDQVYAVFDRDDHDSYFSALNRVQTLDGRLRNDNKELISFKAVASIPSFELWLLLHHEDIQAPIHRDEVMQRLKEYLPDYEKGVEGTFNATRERLESATQKAQALATKFNAYTDPEPYTGMNELVKLLTNLRSE